MELDIKRELAQWFRAQSGSGKHPTFAETMTKAWLLYSESRGAGFTSATQFSKWLDISQAANSHYMNGIREPAGKSIHRIAAKLGPVIYDALDLPRAMPDDEEFQDVASLWFVVPEETRQSVMRLLEEGERKAVAPKNSETAKS